MNSPLMRMVSVGASIGFVMFMLARTSVGWWLVCVVTVLAALCVLHMYVLRYEAPLARRVYANGAGRALIDVLCALTMTQKPGGVKEAAARGGGPSDDGSVGATLAVLTSASEFEACARAIKERIVGHDAAVDAVLNDLRRGVLVRMKRPDSGGSALGAFLLVGPNGIGKRLMAAEIGKGVYPQGELLVLDGREYADPTYAYEDLFGGKGSSGRLLGALKRQPLHTIVMESTHSAHPDVLARLGSMLVHGGCVEPGSGAQVSFEHAMFFFLSSKFADAESAVGQEGIDLQALTHQGLLPTGFAECLHSVISMHPLTQMEKAEVIARIMDEECRRYRVELKSVEPEIIADQVREITAERGFEGVRARIKGLLREDVSRAVEISMPQLSLRRRGPSEPVSGGPGDG